MAATIKKVDIFINGKQAGGTINDLKKQSRKLNNEINQLTPGTDKYVKKVKELSSVNKVLTGHRQKVKGIGGAFSNIKGKLGGFAKSFLGPLGIAGLIGGAFAAVGQWVKKNKELEKSLSSLQSITGASSADLAAYKDAAIEIGASTTLSAKQAVEGFKLIGSAKPELLANKDALISVTKEAVILAEAAELELGPAAQSLAGTLNQFNLKGEESRRVINALAAGSKAGAADIPTITEAMDKFGTVAASNNVQVEQSIGLIETLAEKNIKGAEAGTGLKNVLLTMSTLPALSPEALKQLEKYGVDIEKVSDKTVPFQERLKELSKIADDSTALVKVFGKANVTVGQTLLQNADKVSSYTDAVTDTNTATEQQAINNDNLDGDLKSLSSAWDGFILSMTSGNGVLRNVVQWLIKVLNIMSGSGSIMELLPEWVSLWGDAFDSLENFNKALMSTVKWLVELMPGGKAIVGVLENMTDATKELSAEQQRANKVNSVALAQGKELLQQNKEEIADVSVLIDALSDKNLTREEEQAIIEKLNKDYPELVKNIDLETASTEQLMDVKKQLITQILKQGIEEKKAQALASVTGMIIDRELKKIGAGEAGIRQMNKEIAELTASIPLIEDVANRVTKELEKTVSGMDLSAPFREGLSEIEKVMSIISKLEKKLQNATSDAQREGIERRLKTQRDKLEQLQTIRKSALDDALDLEADLTEGTKANAKERSDARQKELDDLIKALQKLQENVDKLEQEAVDRASVKGADGEEEKELAALDVKLEKKFQKEIAEAERLILAKGEIGAAAQVELDTLILLKTEELEAARGEIEEKFRKIREEKEKAALEKLKKQAVSLKSAEIDLKLLKVSEAIMAETELNGVASRALFDEMTSILIERLELETLLKQEALVLQLENEEITIEEHNARKEELEITFQANKTAIAKQGEEERLREVKSNIQEGLSTATKAVAAFENIALAIHQVKMNRINKERDREINALRQQRDAGIITEEQFQNKKRRIEEKAARKAAEEMRKQAILAKSIALIQAAINTAVAITAASPVVPLMVLAAFAGAAQIAVIASKPIPQAKKGGMKVVGQEDGKNYDASYLGKHPGGMLPGDPSLILASEVGPEYYVPNALLSEPRVARHVGMIEAIRTNQMQDGGFSEAVSGVGSEGGTSVDGTGATLSTLKSLDVTIAILADKIGHIEAKISDATVDEITATQNELAGLRSAS